MSFVLGVDPSTKIVACVARLVGASDPYFTIWRPYLIGSGNFKPETTHDAKEAMEDFLSELARFGPGRRGIAYVEEPVMGRNRVATIRQAYVIGAILAALANHGIPVYLVNNSAWKKDVVGKGNATKDEIKEKMVALHPHLPPSFFTDLDLVDALAIMEYGWHNERKAKGVLNDA